MVRTRPWGSRAGGASAVLLSVVLVLVSACSGNSKAEEKDGADGGASKPAEDTAISIVISPQDGAESVATSGDLKVTAERGTLTEVTVIGPEGEQVEGEFAEDQSSWEPTDLLAPDAGYTVQATGLGDDGKTGTQSAGFTTVTPDATFNTQSLLWNMIEDGSTVGVGTVISITFDAPIEDTAAVRDAIEIVTEPAVEVRGHWFGNQRLDFRPEDYWQPGTEVTVKFRTRGVQAAEGLYGTRYNDRSFVVGRAQTSTVDAAAKTMKVVRDGETLKTLPVTTGAPGTDTWNGKMVISEKHKETRMDGSTVGFGGEYDIPDVPHAMRLSTSGTFIHGNYWAGASTFGSQNVSHGCVGLQDKQGANDANTPAAWLFDNSIIGDVVEVINSNDDILAPDNGWSGWNMAWSAWGAGQ